MNTAYIIGAPGAGKTAVMRELTSDGLAAQRRMPVPHIVYEGGLVGSGLFDVAQIGVDREGFGGTDGLSMAIQPKAVAWVKSDPYAWLLGEGDRLSNLEFFETCTRVGRLWVFYLQVTPDVLAERRGRRRSDQNVSWLAGRESKVRNLLDCIWLPVTRLDANQLLPKELAAKIVEVIHARS